MIPAKYTPLVFAFWMAFFMSLLMSGMITAVNTGMDAGYWGRWLHAWTIALPAAFIVALASRPLVQKMVSVCVAKA